MSIQPKSGAGNYLDIFWCTKHHCHNVHNSMLKYRWSGSDSPTHCSVHIQGVSQHDTDKIEHRFSGQQPEGKLESRQPHELEPMPIYGMELTYMSRQSKLTGKHGEQSIRHPSRTFHFIHTSLYLAVLHQRSSRRPSSPTDHKSSRGLSVLAVHCPPQVTERARY